MVPLMDSVSGMANVPDEGDDRDCGVRIRDDDEEDDGEVSHKGGSAVA